MTNDFDPDVLGKIVLCAFNNWCDKLECPERKVHKPFRELPEAYRCQGRMIGEALHAYLMCGVLPENFPAEDAAAAADMPVFLDKRNVPVHMEAFP